VVTILYPKFTHKLTPLYAFADADWVFLSDDHISPSIVTASDEICYALMYVL